MAGMGEGKLRLRSDVPYMQKQGSVHSCGGKRWAVQSEAGTVAISTEWDAGRHGCGLSIFGTGVVRGKPP